MENPLTRKLDNYVQLSDADKYRLIEVLSPPRTVEARKDIILEGDHPRVINVVLSGWACRYKQFKDGRRQIVSLLLPGDCCDPQIFLLNRMDHGLAAITHVTIAQIPGNAFQGLIIRSPSLDEAFHRETLATLAIQREWTVNLGRRSAIERLAHLFCELHLRLSAVGHAEGLSCPMPLTQPDLADALAQTSVHINRTLQELRHSSMLTLENRRLTILDLDRIRGLAQFDPAYLHFDNRALSELVPES